MREQAGQGFFIGCCLATCKLATTWQNERQLCTISTAICSSTKKTKRGVYGLTKQTNRKPLCNCLLIINGKRRRPELHINPAQLEAHTATLPGTCTACSTVLSSGLPCTCSGAQEPAPDQRGESCARHRQLWPWMRGGQELAEVLRNDSM